MKRVVFVCFTFDDGYVDNYQYALPIFKKYNIPFTVYVTTGLIERTAILWWLHLEEVIQNSRKLEINLKGKVKEYRLDTLRNKNKAFDEIYWKLRDMPHRDRYKVIQLLMDQNESDSVALCNRVGMTWPMVCELADSGLVTIGAHTQNHYALSELSEQHVIKEVEESCEKLMEHLGTKPHHFAYPYGDSNSAAQREFQIIKKLGFDTATTTRKGVLFPEHLDHKSALPRVSLNGNYQSKHFVRLFLSGAPFAISNRFKRVNYH